MTLSFFNFLQDVPVRIAYAISLHGVALLIVGALALILASGVPSVTTEGDSRRWRWFGWFAMLKGVGVVASLALGSNCSSNSRYFFEAVYMAATLPAWLAGAQFAWFAWRRRPAWATRRLPVIVWLAAVGGAVVAGGWNGLGFIHGVLAIVVGGMVLVTLIREAREMERLGFELGVVSLMLVATGLAGLVGLECAGWEYYGRMQGWTMNTLPFFIRREYGLMVAGSAFSILFASGWWFWMRQHVVRNGVRGWLKQSLWLVPVGLLVMSAAGFTVLNRIKIEGGARADRIFELRLRTVRLGLEMAGLQTDGGGPELVKALGRQAMANPDLDAIAFVRMAGGRLETVASTATAISIPTHPYLWRERGDLDPRFAEGRTAFGSSFMQDAEGAFALYCEPWPHPGEGWLVFRVSFETWAETMGPVLMQATFIIVLAGVLAVSAVVFMIQRELGTDSRLSIARAEAASRAKTELLSRASHELRTPIQGVLGYAELLERSELSPGQLEWVQAVRNQGAHLLRLVNDLLDLGALQNGRLSIEAAMMSPINVAREAMAGVRPLAQAKKLSCLMAVDETVPAWVLGDATRLRQVLVNLLGNAVKFTDAGEVRLGLRARLEGDCWRLSFEVSDTGPGIAPEDLRWIFESPRRARRLPTEGAGLGLALARGLCEAMGGDLQAQSRLGRGSTFVATVVLPEMVTPETAAAPVAPEELPRLGLRVLVVEDNTALRHLFGAWLRKLECSVVMACDGETALAKAKGGAFDVIVLDLGLPGIDGREVARRVRTAEAGGESVWLVGLSAHASEEDRRMSLEAGMDIFLSKPIDLPVLARALRRERSAVASTGTGGWLQSRLLKGPQMEALKAAAQAETPAILEELREAVSAGNWRRVAESAHYLCNTADLFGAGALRDVCCECENAAREGRPAEAARAADEITRLAVEMTAGGRPVGVTE